MYTIFFIESTKKTWIQRKYELFFSLHEILVLVSVSRWLGSCNVLATNSTGVGLIAYHPSIHPSSYRPIPKNLQTKHVVQALSKYNVPIIKT